MALNDVQELLTASAALWGGLAIYVYLFVLLMSFSLGLPGNSDLTLILTGALASMGYFQLPYAIATALCAILTGDTITFFMGRKFGEKILASRLIRKLFSVEKQERARTFLLKNSARFIFMIRFTPGFRAVVFLTAGTMKIAPRTFFTMNILSTSFYIPLLLTLSYFTASHLQEWITGYQSVLKWIFSAVALFVIYLGLKWLTRTFSKWIAARSQ